MKVRMFLAPTSIEASAAIEIIPVGLCFGNILNFVVRRAHDHRQYCAGQCGNDGVSRRVPKIDAGQGDSKGNASSCSIDLSGVHMTSALHIVCPHCDSINRVPRERLRQRSKCGSCHRPLYEGRPAALNSAPLASTSM